MHVNGGRSTRARPVKSPVTRGLLALSRARSYPLALRRIDYRLKILAQCAEYGICKHRLQTIKRIRSVNIIQCVTLTLIIKLCET